MSMMSYNCPSCGASLVFVNEAQPLVCGTCSNEFELNAVKTFYEAKALGEGASFNWGAFGESEEDWGHKDPDLIIPFKVSKESAIEAFERFCQGRPLLPEGYASKERTERMTGIYLPVWLIDGQARGAMNFKGERTKRWKEGNNQVTESKHYLLRRGGVMSFDQVPVGGGERINSQLRKTLEPFDLDEAIDFQTSYLESYIVDKSACDFEKTMETDSQPIHDNIDLQFSQAVNTFDSTQKLNSRVELYDLHRTCVLMPIWVLNSRCDEKDYIFAMNGQTGKVVGDLPLSKKKLRSRRLKILSFTVILGFCLSMFYKVVM